MYFMNRTSNTEQSFHSSLSAMVTWRYQFPTSAMSSSLANLRRSSASYLLIQKSLGSNLVNACHRSDPGDLSRRTWLPPFTAPAHSSALLISAWGLRYNQTAAQSRAKSVAAGG